MSRAIIRHFTIFYFLPSRLIFWHFTIVYICCRAPNFQIEQQNLYLRALTPSSAVRPFRARSLKFMPRWPHPLELVLEKIVCICHDFILEFKYTFYFSTTLLFALSRFHSSPTFISSRVVCLFLARYFVSCGF